MEDPIPDPDWLALRETISVRFPSAMEASPDSVRLVLAASDDPAVRVAVRVTASRAYGEPTVVIAADLGSAGTIDTASALALNNLLVHGALAARNGVLELRAVRPLAAQTPGDFERALRQLAAEAAELKPYLTHSDIAITLAYGHYAA